jgi:hypothetical protein
MTSPSATESEPFTLDEARAHYAGYLDGLPLKAIALAILDHVEETGGSPFYFEDAVRAAGRTEIDGEVMATISHLTNGRRSALSREFVYRDPNGGEHPVAGETLVRARDEGLFEDPVTGAPVENPQAHLFFRFQPRPGLLEPSSPSP